MLSPELVKQVKRIELSTRRAVDDLMSGRFRTHFKGHGMQFTEHRQYVAGDDVRHIDWKTSARAREPQVKKYEEERELTALLVVDISGSEGFGSAKKLKSEMAAELAGMLAYAAVRTGDKIGVVLFGATVEKLIPPRKGRAHVYRVIHSILGAEPKPGGTGLGAALDAAGRAMRHKGIVFVLSDFQASGWEDGLKRLARRHDVVAIWTRDPREAEIPRVGTVLLRDAESGAVRLVDTGGYAFRKWFDSFRAEQNTVADRIRKGGRVELVEASTREDYIEALVRFFRERKRARR